VREVFCPPLALKGSAFCRRKVIRTTKAEAYLHEGGTFEKVAFVVKKVDEILAPSFLEQRCGTSKHLVARGVVLWLRPFLALAPWDELLLWSWMALGLYVQSQSLMLWGACEEGRLLLL
jgi:hypothetical protein